MAGIFGFYAFGEERSKWNALRFIYYGLQALQGRGEEASSIAWVDDEGEIQISTARGGVEKLLEAIEHGRGCVGIGMTSAYEDDYVALVEKPVKLAIIGDGRVAGGESKQSSFKKLGEDIAKKLYEGYELIDSAADSIARREGGFSFIALTERGEVICGRSKLGVKPLTVGSIGFDIGCIASETAALDVVGASTSYEIQPGELLAMTPLSIRRSRVDGAKDAICAFEYIYLARHDSQILGRPVYEVRERIGRLIAMRDSQQADVVIGVPDTAMPSALSYAEEKKMPCRLGFASTGRHVRSALKPTQIERIIGLQLKLNPIESVVYGKDIVLIDDSMVRGNTLKNVISSLRRRGALRIHVRIGSPPIIAGCPFGTEIPQEDELISRSVGPEEINNLIGCDSLRYLSVDELIEAIGIGRENVCTGCFTGRYPGGGHGD